MQSRSHSVAATDACHRSVAYLKTMQPRKSILLLVVGALLLSAGYALYIYIGRSPATVPEAPISLAPAQSGVVRSPPGAPQLQFIATQGVILLPEPLLEPLN